MFCDMCTPKLSIILPAGTMGIQSAALTPHVIADKLLGEFTQGCIINHAYIPKHRLHELRQPEVVRKTITFQKHFSPSKRHRVRDYAIENPIVFLTCVSIKKVSSIQFFQESGFSDADFPVKWPANSDVLCSADQERTWACGRDEDGKPWGAMDRMLFIENQWWASAITFDENAFALELDPKCPLPYVALQLETTRKEPGHFGEVQKIGLLEEHLQSPLPKYLSQVGKNYSYIITVPLLTCARSIPLLFPRRSIKWP